MNRYVRGVGEDEDAVSALGGFVRFPSWMWRNTDVLDFVRWLRIHNDAHSPGKRVGFYGLDLYSLHASIDAVLGYLKDADPEAARRARYRYGCFDHFGEDPHAYGYAAAFGMNKSCEQQVVAQLLDLRKQRSEALREGLLFDVDAQFEAEQNARVVRDAEQYYRAMFRGRISSWNLRDTHMAETLDALLLHLGPQSKIIVWAHNSHVGDARATQMGQAGEIDIGELVRQRHPNQTRLIGFSTHHGSVTAASEWGGAAERKWVRPALPDSYEHLFHEVGIPRFLLDLRDLGEAAGALREPRLQRAIGVLYLPQTERQSHYFHARLPEQFDAILHFDETRALEPLDRTSRWDEAELPETYPSGL